MKAGTIFDNIFISDSIEEAYAFAAKTWALDVPLERAAKEAFDKAQEEQLKETAKSEDTDDELAAKTRASDVPLERAAKEAFDKAQEEQLKETAKSEDTNDEL